MRRCRSLCSESTRRKVDAGEDFIPLVMKAQSRRNLQKIMPSIPLDSDTFAFSAFATWIAACSPYSQGEWGKNNRTNSEDMIRNIAEKLIDPSQGRYEADGALSDPPPPSAQSSKSMAGVMPLKGKNAEAELRVYVFPHIFSSRDGRSLQVNTSPLVKHVMCRHCESTAVSLHSTL